MEMEGRGGESGGNWAGAEPQTWTQFRLETGKR